MRRFDISNSPILWAFKDVVPVYAGKVAGEDEYQPFTNDINGAIDFLSRTSTPSSNILNKYLGDATSNDNRKTKLTAKFGNKVGDYAGIYVERDDDNYYKVQLSLTATYGGGSEVVMTGYGWVKESDITNVEKELDAAVEAGDVNLTKLELAKRRAEEAKAEADAAAKKDDTPKDNSTDLGKKAVIDGNQSLDASKTNWLLIGGIFVGVVALGGGLLYAFRTPKTP